MVQQVHHLDPSGWIYFTATGREPDRDPYLRHLYRARLDGSRIELLTPEAADHAVSVGPGASYITDTYSTVSEPPMSVVRDGTGRVVHTIETASVDALEAAGWTPPVPFTAKGRDGLTNVHGLLYFPSRMDSLARYPVVDYVYPGPQTGPIRFRHFNAAPAGNPRAIAELGFVVFVVDAFGTPARSEGVSMTATTGTWVTTGSRIT